MAKESRRKFLKTVPAAVAGVTVAGKAFAQGQGPQAPAGPITVDTIECADRNRKAPPRPARNSRTRSRP